MAHQLEKHWSNSALQIRGKVKYQRFYFFFMKYNGFQSQYRFVCESVHRAYSEGIVKPLPEFHR